MAISCFCTTLGCRVAAQILVRTLSVPRVFDAPGSEYWGPDSRILRALLKLSFSYSNRSPNQMFSGLDASRARFWDLGGVLETAISCFRTLEGPSGRPDPCAYTQRATHFRSPWLRILGTRFLDFVGPPEIAHFRFQSYLNSMFSGLDDSRARF